MRRWKRPLLFLCVLIVAMVVFVNRGGRKTPTVAILFAGYTNTPIYGLSGVIRVTNTGPVAVKLWSIFHTVVPTNDLPRIPDSRTTTFGPGITTYRGLQILEPGTAATAEVSVPPGYQISSLSAGVSPWRLGDRIRDWAESFTNSTIQRWAVKIAPTPPPVTTMKLEFITNQIPTNIYASPR